MLEFLKDLLLALKDISKTVPDSGEWWLATYQDRMSWLPRTPEQLSLDDAVRRFLGLSEIPQRAPKRFTVSTWEPFHNLHNLKKLKFSFKKGRRSRQRKRTMVNLRKNLLHMFQHRKPNSLLEPLPNVHILHQLPQSRARQLGVRKINHIPKWRFFHR
jgi:hypothetical protein